MGLSNIGSKVSQKDLEMNFEAKNPPEYEAGYSGSAEEEFNSIFDSIDSLDGGFGKADTGNSSFGATGVAGPTSFGAKFDGTAQAGAPGVSGAPGESGIGLNGSVLGMNTQVQQKPKGPDLLDMTGKYCAESSIATGSVLKEAIISIKNRNLEEYGKLAVNTILTGLSIGAIGIISAIISGIYGVEIINNIGVDLGCAGIGLTGVGICGLGTSALLVMSGVEIGNKSKAEEEAVTPVQDTPSDDDISDFFSDEDAYSEEDEYDDFGLDIDETYEEEVAEITSEEEVLDYENILEETPSNAPINGRETLFNIFSKYFPTNTPKFDSIRQIHEGSSEFDNLEILVKKALAAASKTDFDKLDCRLLEASRSLYSYNLVADRIKGADNLNKIAQEVNAYFRDNSSDVGVNSTVYIERDTYRIVVSEDLSPIVTLGDIFNTEDGREFFTNTKKKLPIVCGVGETGEPLFLDAKDFDTMLIAGRPRSGKSWFMLCVLMNLIAFNTPEEVQMLIIDPKEAPLLKTFSLLPHVCGYHQADNIVKILDDLINIEAPRRKKLLDSTASEDIWELRSQGIMLPILYIVIDEVMTVLSEMGAKGIKDEFEQKLKVVITQFPSLGIKMILIPHRAQGVVDKTIRMNIGFSAAVRAEETVVNETLGLKRWDRPLINPGDTAVKVQTINRPMFIKGCAVAIEDRVNKTIIKNMAKAFYKIGVDMPDMTTVGEGHNRNEKRVHDELYGDSSSSHLQYTASNVFDNEIIDL